LLRLVGLAYARGMMDAEIKVENFMMILRRSIKVGF